MNTFNKFEGNIKSPKEDISKEYDSLNSNYLNSKKKKKKEQLKAFLYEFQKKLGENWHLYHETLSLFLVAKISRKELVQTVFPILKDGLIKYHNKFMFMNISNSFKNEFVDLRNDFFIYWNESFKKTIDVKSESHENLKMNVLKLSMKERKRIKNIVMNSQNRNKPISSLFSTRQSLLPRVIDYQTKDRSSVKNENFISFQNDILNGINTPLSAQTLELPDYDNLSKRIIMSMREHGLTGDLNSSVLDIILLGLEFYLKNIIETAIDVVKYRKYKYDKNDYIFLNCIKKDNNDWILPSKKTDLKSSKNEITLNLSDLHDTFQIFPHLIESYESRMRLSNMMLQNDDYNYNKIDYINPNNLKKKTKTNNIAYEEDCDQKEQIKSNKKLKLNPKINMGSNKDLHSIIKDLIAKI